MLTKVFPFLLWFKDYDVGKFKIDFLAGLTVALVLIPQSMAYAQLAGLPAYYGLYAAFLPPIVASLFGSSRQLATGPVAVVSLMSAASLEPLATAGGEAFIAYSILLALIVGIFQLSLGVLRLGLVVNFLSHPVINGFTNAAAIIIASSQFSKFFGVYVDKAPHHYETMSRVFNAAMDFTHWPTLAFGVGAVAIMVTLRKINPRIPNVLVAVAITTVISYFIGFNNDARVDVSAIQMNEVGQWVEEFNQAVSTVNELGEKRAEVGLQIDELLKDKSGSHGGGSSIDLINLQSEVAVLTARMAQAKEEAHLVRTDLRGLKFEAVQDNEAYVFYPKTDIPPGIETDGNTWRIKVGNSSLKAEDLLMMGGGDVVGTIPQGLPTLSIPHLDMKIFFKLFPTAVIISLLGFMEAIAIAKAMAAKTGQKLDANQELIGQGLGNILGSIGSSYAVSGSFSRSAVNLQAGAVSGISAVVTSIMVVITLLFLTPLLYYLPQAVLASVIMMAVIGLVNAQGFMHAWKAQWYDGAISIFTFLCTLAFAPHLDKGIMIGVALSLFVFLYKSMRPKVLSLSMCKDMVLKSASHCGLKEDEHFAVIRFDGPLFFANASYLDEKVAAIRTSKPELKHILLVAEGINEMDASGEEELSLLVSRVRSAGIGFGMVGLKAHIVAVMERTHLLEKIGQENIYPSNEEAVGAIHALHDVPEDKQSSSPLLHYIPSAN